MKTTIITFHLGLSLLCLGFAVHCSVFAEKMDFMELDPEVTLIIDGDEHEIRATEPAVPETMSPAMKKLTSTKITTLSLSNQSARTVFKMLESYTAGKTKGKHPFHIIYKVPASKSITFTAKIENMTLLDSIKYFAQAANYNYLITDNAVIIYDRLSGSEITRLIKENQKTGTNNVGKSKK
jgi:hypothetical protein